MTHRLVPSSSDIVVEAEASDLGEALVEIARAFTEVTTHGGRVKAQQTHGIILEKEGDLPLLAVAFVNHLVFLFSTEQFLPHGGTLRVTRRGNRNQVQGELQGETFDPARHSLGTEVKAATFHDARFEEKGGRAHVRLLLDL